MDSRNPNDQILSNVRDVLVSQSTLCNDVTFGSTKIQPNSLERGQHVHRPNQAVSDNNEIQAHWAHYFADMRFDAALGLRMACNAGFFERCSMIDFFHSVVRPCSVNEYSWVTTSSSTPQSDKTRAHSTPVLSLPKSRFFLWLKPESCLYVLARPRLL